MTSRETVAGLMRLVHAGYIIRFESARTAGVWCLIDATSQFDSAEAPRESGEAEGIAATRLGAIQSALADFTYMRLT